jgi:enamine deaminase RidA (YjgF/YER057c/UK114 family)
MVKHINPEGMHQNPAYSQAILVPASARILFIGGQNAVGADGKIVGGRDIAAQTEQAVSNLEKVLKAAGAGLENLVRVGIFLVADVDLRPGFEVWMKHWGKREKPPIVTGLRVSGLAHPDFLIEIEATAVLP